MQFLRAADYRRMPWKNGKGETVEIAVFPPGASVDSFDWRISTATVAEDGPFSHFADIDRTLSVLTGDGMTLSIEGHEPLLLEQSSRPHVFPGDAATTATLTGGPITDLNVMTRRGRFRHRVTRLLLQQGTPVQPRSDLTILIVTGTARVADTWLHPMDAVLLEASDPGLTLQVDTDTPAFLIEIDAINRA